MCHAWLQELGSKAKRGGGRWRYCTEYRRLHLQAFLPASRDVSDGARGRIFRKMKHATKTRANMSHSPKQFSRPADLLEGKTLGNEP